MFDRIYCILYHSNKVLLSKKFESNGVNAKCLYILSRTFVLLLFNIYDCLEV